MHKLRNYILCIIISIVMFFVMTAAEAVLFTKFYVFNISTYTEVIKEKEVSAKVYSELKTYYQSQSNATGIPENVYTDTITPEDISPIISDSVRNTFDYVNGKTDIFTTSSHELTPLKDSIESFFSKYAASINYKKDDAYYEKVNSTYSEAETYIFETSDVFQFSKIDKAGYLSKMRTAVKYLDIAVIASISALVFFILLLIAANHKNIKNCMYWLSISTGLTSVLFISGCAYLKITRYFDSFAIKAPHIFSALTGLFNKFTDQLLMINGCLFGLSIFLLIIYIFKGMDKRLSGMTEEKKNHQEANDNQVS